MNSTVYSRKVVQGVVVTFAVSPCACKPDRTATWQERTHGYCANYAVLRGAPHPPTYWVWWLGAWQRLAREDFSRMSAPGTLSDADLDLAVHRTNDESPAVRAGRDKPNLTASRRGLTGPDVSMKRPEAGSSPACTTQP